MATAPKLVRVTADRETGVAVVTLNRPDKKNALSRDLLSQLMEALQEVCDSDDIHCIVLDAAGDSFSSGQDLYDLRKDWGEGKRKKSRWNKHHGSTMAVVKFLRDARQITIAAVNGYCLGGGMVLMNACDLAFAAEDAKIGMPEIIRGSYGRSATPTLFLSGIPMKTAFFIQLTGRNLSGIEAARVGLVCQAVPAAELKTYVMEIAREIASRNPVALEHAKIAAYTQVDLPFDLAVKADDTIGHRMRFYVDPLSDVDEYLASQKGGTNLGYRAKLKTR